MTRVFKFVGLAGVFLGVLQLCSCTTGSGGQPPLPGAVAINEDAGRGGPLLVTLRLEDGQELSMLVDTGSPITVLDTSLEPKLGRRLDTMPIGTVGHSQKESGIYAAPRLYLDKTRLMTGSKVAAFQSAPYHFHRPMGILGMDCLQHYCIQLDFEAGQMRFLNPGQASSSELGKAFPMTFAGVGPRRKFIRPLITHPGLVGNNTHLVIDTGCAIDGLLEEGASEPSFTGRVNLAECTWDGKTYTNITVAAVDHANVLGLRFLARHLVTLDFPGHTMYLKKQRSGPLEAENQPAPNPQGGANGRQPIRSETSD